LKRLVIAYVIFFCVSAAVLFATRYLWGPGDVDFSSFYSAGSIIRSGEGAQLYDYGTQQRAQQQFIAVLPDRKAPLLYPHAPFETVLFAPLSYLPYKSAYLVWWAINHALFFAALVMLYKVLEHGPAILPASVVSLCLFFPLIVAFIQGQDSILLVFLLSLTLLYVARDREFLAGVVLSLTLFKPQLALPVFLLSAIRASRAFVFGFLTGCAGLLLLSLSLVGVGGAASFAPFLKLYSELPISVSGADPMYMANVRGMIFRVDPNAPHWYSAAIAGAILLASVLIVWRSGNRKADLFRHFAFAVTVALIVSFHTMPHDLTALIVPFLIATSLLLREKIVGFPKVPLTISAMATMWIPLLTRNAMYEFVAMTVFAGLIWINFPAPERGTLNGAANGN
jgi:hypothetical protein